MRGCYKCDRGVTGNSRTVVYLQDLNALPFAAMAINCAAWVFYAMLLEDYYIYFGNLPGMLLGMFYVLTCYKFSKEAVRGHFVCSRTSMQAICTDRGCKGKGWVSAQSCSSTERMMVFQCLRRDHLLLPLLNILLNNPSCFMWLSVFALHKQQCKHTCNLITL